MPQRRPRARPRRPKTATAPARSAVSPGRSAALEAILAAAARFPDLLPGEPDTSGLDDRDAGLARAVYGVTLRHWLAIEHAAARWSRRDPRGLDPPVRAALLAGGAQLLFLDRVPDHAAIGESVEWAKARSGPGASGLVNAVLRRVARMRSGRRPIWSDGLDELPTSDGGAIVLDGLDLPDTPERRWSIACSLSPRLVESWRSALGPEHARTICHGTLAQPPTLLNTAFAGGALEGVEPHSVDGVGVWTGSRRGLIETLERRDDLWPQDAASCLALGPTEGLRPDRVVDLCAGLGTKTRHLLHLFPGATIVAADVDAARLEELGRIFEGHRRVAVVHADEAGKREIGRADLVVVDAPCSNSGVLRRRPEARYRFHPKQTARLIEIQRGVLARGATLLSPDGALLYATCSLQAAENDGQTAWAAEHLGLCPALERLTMPGGAPGSAARDLHDGGYAALLRRAQGRGSRPEGA